jgi:ribosome maturation factor RimP
MPKQKVADLVQELAMPIAAELGLSLVEVEYKKEGANWMLRVFLDRPDGAVDLDDCAHVSERLSAALDELDPIDNAYFLEVSSAGAERPLKTARDYEAAVGRLVHLTFYEPFAGAKTLEGTLVTVRPEALVVAPAHAEPLEVPLERLASARLAVML